MELEFQIVQNFAQYGLAGAICGVLLYIFVKNYSALQKHILGAFDNIFQKHFENAEKQTQSINELTKNVGSTGMLLYKEIEKMRNELKEVSKADQVSKNHKEVMVFLKEMELRLTHLLELKKDEQ